MGKFVQQGSVFTVTPGVTDDASEGWAPGAVWNYSTTGEIYVCQDNTLGAAVWKRFGPADPVVAGTSTSLAATINGKFGLLTTESLSTAAAGTAVFVITNSKAAVGDVVVVTRMGGTSTTGSLEVSAVITAGTITITLTNRHASVAFNGTFIFGFAIHKA